MKIIEEILFKITGVKNIHSTTYNASEVEMAMNEYKTILDGEWQNILNEAINKPIN